MPDIRDEVISGLMDENDRLRGVILELGEAVAEAAESMMQSDPSHIDFETWAKLGKLKAMFASKGGGVE